MSEHAAVKDEHHKLAAKFFTSVSAETLIEGQVENLLAQQLADFARDERVKEAELLRSEDFHEHNAFEPNACDCRFCKRIEQLKRGEL